MCKEIFSFPRAKLDISGQNRILYLQPDDGVINVPAGRQRPGNPEQIMIYWGNNSLDELL